MENDKLFDLMSKMYSEMQDMNTNLNAKIDSIDTRVNSIDTRVNSIDTRVNSIDTRVNSIDTRVNSIECDVKETKSLQIRMEQTLNEKLSALFDGYKQNTDQLNRISEEVAKHEEVIIRRVK